jgi:hypothetical protein
VWNIVSHVKGRTRLRVFENGMLREMFASVRE